VDPQDNEAEQTIQTPVFDKQPVFEHQPVMAAEVVATFASVPSGFVLDATLGGGGHSELLLEHYPHLRILGIDRDQQALQAASRRLARFGDRFRMYHCRFDNLRDAMAATSLSELSGALFDLGVSSPQLDHSERGFSYRNDAPLDMRMNADDQLSAHDVVNNYDEAQLSRVLDEYGDERFARRIARAIVAQRPIHTTVALAEVIVSAIPAAARRTGGHPAKRSFQAIRIEVNAELVILPDALNSAIRATGTGGRIAVLSYHSGEDRITKSVFRSAATGDCTCPSGLPCVCGAVRLVEPVRRVAKHASVEEVARNRRASSALYRVVQRTAEQQTATSQDWEEVN
jgi:16S rRNA (cytosine1402-N4)-methyltransferase